MWIDTEEKLSVAIADLLETEVVAVDTEYDSFHYSMKTLSLASGDACSLLPR